MEESIRTYRQALTAYPNDPVILNDLGLCLARAGETAEALSTLEAAVRAMPNSQLYRNNLAALLVESNRPDDAVTILSETYGPAVAHYNVGYLLQQRGNEVLAFDHFSRSLNYDANMYQARAMLDRLAPRIGARPDQQLEPTASPSQALPAQQAWQHSASHPDLSSRLPRVLPGLSNATAAPATAANAIAYVTDSGPAEQPPATLAHATHVPQLLPPSSSGDSPDDEIERSVQLFADEHAQLAESGESSDSSSVVVASHVASDPEPVSETTDDESPSVRLPGRYAREPGYLVPPMPREL
jgi:tetratricopeptide (TPR) repeat protein